MFYKHPLPAFLFATVFLAVPINTVSAQFSLVPPEIAPISNMVSVVRAFIQLMIVVAFVLAFIMLLVGGLKLIVFGGSEKGSADARRTIISALVGLILVLSSFAIIRLVEIFFGVTVISNTLYIPTLN